MESEYRAGKETEKKDNYLHPQFKYRNEYNIYLTNEDNNNNKTTVQIGKELKERNVSETRLRKERRGKDESTGKIYNNNNNDIITNNVKNQRGRKSSESMIKI